MINKLKNKTYRFLKWTEKWTKTDMVYLFKGNFWTSLAQITSNIFSLILAVAFANLIPKETYGQYKYIISVLGLLSISTLSGMSISMIQSIANGYEGILYSILKTKIKWGLLGSLGSLILTFYYYFNNNSLLATSFFLIAIFLPFFQSTKIYGAFLNGKKLFNLSAKFQIISNLFITTSIILTLFLKKNLILILFAYLLSNFLINLFFYYYTNKNYKSNNKIDKKVVNYGKNISFINFFSTILENLDKILIFHYVGATELAIYTFALTPISQIKSLISKNVAILALPKLSKLTIKDIRNTLPEKIKKYFLITTFIAIIYVLMAPFIFKIFFPQYILSIKYSQILSITLALSPFVLINTTLLSQKRNKELYIQSTTTGIFKLLLLLILLPHFGVLGVVITIISHQIFAILLSIYLFKKI